MVEVVVDWRRSVAENAKACYDRSKKLKAKLDGMGKAIAETRRKLDSAVEEPVNTPRIVRKPERKWYEKFRWFTSTDGFMVLGGRDATTNELLVKKHLEPNDLVFHAQIQGAPFFVVKNPEGRVIPEATLRQAACAAASYSRAWAKGMGSADVYHVKPGQVSKTPPAGEYLPKGAFMVYGEKTWHKGVELKAAVGLVDGRVVGGPPEAVLAQTGEYVVLGVGDTPQGELTRKVKARLRGAESDDIQRFLPPGGGEII